MLTVFPESSISANMHFSFVSVVMMALWTSSPPDASAPAHCSMPLIIMSIGIGWPMTPVEYTSTSSGFTSRSSAVFSAIESASCMPWSPVHAFALPLFMIMARVVGFWTCFISVSTGAAFTTLVVKTAALTAGTSLYMSPMSFLPLFLSPTAHPAAL